MRVFLTAEWRDLLMLNYTADPQILRGYLPAGLELDFWNNCTYVSMVGFRFLNTKVFGISVPQHTNFEEVNLRFYVRKKTEGWRRGVVFIREIVPRRAIAAVAKFFYNEPYVSMPMRHSLPATKPTKIARYEWFFGNQWNSLSAEVCGNSHPLKENSEEEFITEHYWGYTPQPKRGFTEYAVEHPRWNIIPVRNAILNCEIEGLYGAMFKEILRGQPASAFLAEGSSVVVRSAASI